MKFDDTTYENEVEILSTLQRLKHPNILNLVGCYTYKFKHNLISPYIIGGTLKDFLKQPKPEGLCQEELFYAISGLASAVWALHEFVLDDTVPSLKGHHQDLRPDNILVDANRFILADFGLSSIKSIEEDSKTPFKGRKGYCQAPECANLGHPYQEHETTRKTDIFALACIIADLLVYLVHGANGVELFRDAREFHMPPMCYYLFHKGNAANDTVATWLRTLGSETRDRSFQDVVDVVINMLNIDPRDRPDAAAVTAQLYISTITAFSERLSCLFNRFPSSPDACVENARFVSWSMSQDTVLYTSSPGATTTGKIFDSAVDILRQLKCALESIDPAVLPLDCRSFIEVRALNTQLLNMLSSERRSSAMSRLESILLARMSPEKLGETYITINNALGDSQLNRRAKTKQLVTEVDDATSSFVKPPFHLINGSVRRVRSVGSYFIARLQEEENHDKVVLVETIHYQDQLRRQRLLPRVHALCNLLSSDQLGQELRIPGFYGLHEDTDAFCFEIIYDLPSDHQSAGPRSIPTSLQELLRESEQRHYPSREKRLRLALQLAESLASFHDLTWFHKDLTSSNVLFFPSRQTALQARADHPYLVGFQHSRHANEDFTEGPLQDRGHQRYHHPLYISVENQQFTKFRPQFDWYSFGILLIEIGLWQTIDQFMQEHSQKNNHDFFRTLIHDQLPMLAFSMGDEYVDIIRSCLTGRSETSNAPEMNHLDAATNLMWKQDVVIPLQSLTRTHPSQSMDQNRKRAIEISISSRTTRKRKSQV